MKISPKICFFFLHQGDKGTEGIQGDDGPPGAHGLIGEMGPRGFAGPRGFPGALSTPPIDASIFNIYFFNFKVRPEVLE